MVPCILVSGSYLFIAIVEYVLGIQLCVSNSQKFLMSKLKHLENIVFEYHRLNVYFRYFWMKFLWHVQILVSTNKRVNWYFIPKFYKWLFWFVIVISFFLQFVIKKILMLKRLVLPLILVLTYCFTISDWIQKNIQLLYQ